MIGTLPSSYSALYKTEVTSSGILTHPPRAPRLWPKLYLYFSNRIAWTLTMKRFIVSQHTSTHCLAPAWTAHPISALHISSPSCERHLQGRLFVGDDILPPRPTYSDSSTVPSENGPLAPKATQVIQNMTCMYGPCANGYPKTYPGIVALSKHLAEVHKVIEQRRGMSLPWMQRAREEADWPARACAVRACGSVLEVQA